MQKTVAVFRLHQPAWSEPAYFVDRDAALRMVRDEAAILVNRGRAVRLTFQNPAHLRDESCRISPNTMFAFACGVPHAVAAVEGWNRSGDFAIS
ncbi:MAG TPA: hypothetical protein VFQ00_01165 [Terriglobales bacterium]|nr:hypothetical protein [Terriglobales bacterium]